MSDIHTIGILGGGQLGRMLSLAASRLGLSCHIYDPDPDAPAKAVSATATTAGWDDLAALTAFASAVDVVTYEFENIPTEALDAIEAAVEVHPSRTALATSQDRLTEKRFIESLGLQVAPYRVVDSSNDLEAALEAIGPRAILKTRRFGYDGKGQVRTGDGTRVADAMDQIGQAPAVLEGYVEFSEEISVIAARDRLGRVVAFDPGQNIHKAGILRTTEVPARVSDEIQAEAVKQARSVLEALGYVGVIGVEFFVTPDGLLINEFAPRVHNSGHWTQNGATCCQFEQHVRALAGWPLGSGARVADVRMENLIGDDMDKVPELAETGAALHLYGKSEVRPGRKMGHVNHVKALKVRD